MGLPNTNGPLPKPTWTLRANLSLIGFTAVTAQVVLMRELLVVFYGNELALGVMLANWLFWTALGSSLVGLWAKRARNPRRLLAGLEVLTAFTLPLTLLAVRSSKTFFHSIPGEILGPVPMFLTSFVALSAFCVISGGLFAAGSRLFAESTGRATAAATGAVYLLEAVGSGLGGLLTGLALVWILTPFEIAALTGALNLAAAWAILSPAGAKRRLLAASFAALAVLVIVGSCALGPLSLRLLWRGFDLIATRNSVYGSLAVVETGASRSLFENGLIVMTVPDPAAAEEAVHYALLEHPAPHRLLLIGGGVNGSVATAFSHPSLSQVDYVELDPMILDLAGQYFPQAWEKIRSDPRVRVHTMDGRRYLKSTTDSFDVIIVNLPDPHNAQLNRFYTEEFFREAAAKLGPGGIVSFQVTSSENYISAELADFLRCLQRTLRAVFPEVVAIPGETVHFFAANRAGTLVTDPKELVRRMQARRLHTEYVRESFLPFRMSPDRMLDLELQIAPQSSTPINHDFAPVAYYFDVALWSTRFYPASGRWIESLAGVKFGRVLWGAALALAVLLSCLWLWPAGRAQKQAARARRTAAFAVATMGFTELGLEILLLLGFQALYGYVYHELTILVALFMVGMALGGWWALRSAPSQGRGTLDGVLISDVAPGSSPAHAALKGGATNQLGRYPSLRRDLRLLAGMQILLAAAPLLLFGLFIQLGRVSSMGGQRAASEILFPALALVAGLLGGFQFLLASRVYFGDAPESSRSPGALYALDLAGACAAALALSLLLIPVYGFMRTAVLIAAVNLAPAALAAGTGRVGLPGQASPPPSIDARQRPAP
jgi:spermidine synthase